MKRLPVPCLMLVTEPCQNLMRIAAEAVAGGVNAVQWRDKRQSIGKRAGWLSGLAAAVGDQALLLANGDWEANVRAGARRLHLPEKSIPIGVVRFKAGSGACIGKSVHSPDAALQAERDGADYLVVGTIYASQSHPETPAAGLDFLREVCAAVAIPVLAIGGVTPERVGECIAAGASGVAVLSPIMRADDPRAAAQLYRDALDAAWETKTCN